MPSLVITSADGDPLYPNGLSGSLSSKEGRYCEALSFLGHDHDWNTSVTVARDSLDLCDRGHSDVSADSSPDAYALTGGLAPMSPMNRWETESVYVVSELRSVVCGSSAVT